MREVEVAAEAVFAGLPDGGVIVHTGTKRYYSLTQTGARIWGRLESTGEPSAVATAIATEYGIPPEEAIRAVTELTERLLVAGLVTRSDGDKT